MFSFKLIFAGIGAGTGYYWYERLLNGPAVRSVALLSQYYDSPTTQPTHGVYDIGIIGGGIIGVTIARELRARYPDKSIVLLEKEATVACHQSGHNSGVIHAGIYDSDTSLKTKLCLRGNKLMYEYCTKHNLPVRNVGKLVVATTPDEVETLHKVFDQAVKNGAENVSLLDSEGIKKFEPNVVGLKAMHCPSNGIADFGAVTRHVLKELEAGASGKKGSFRFIPKMQVEAIGTKATDHRICLLGREPGQRGPAKVVEVKKLITCAGLHMDHVARMAGGAQQPTIVPFRGTYYELKGDAKNIVKMNIYPTPRGGGNPVGVHFTPTVNVERGEQMILGPSAGLGTHKEAYSPLKFNLKHMADIVFSSNNWIFLMKRFPVICEAMHQDLSRAAFIADAKRMVPSLKDEDVVPSFAGVMAQCFGPDGKTAPDFMFEATTAPLFYPKGETAHSSKVFHEKNCFHTRNLPSPGGTSSFALAEEIVTRAHREAFIG